MTCKIVKRTHFTPTKEAEAGIHLNRACARGLGWRLGSYFQKIKTGTGKEHHTYYRGIRPRDLDKDYDEYGRWHHDLGWRVIWAPIPKFSERIHTAYKLVGALEQQGDSIIRVTNGDGSCRVAKYMGWNRLVRVRINSTDSEAYALAIARMFCLARGILHIREVERINERI